MPLLVGPDARLVNSPEWKPGLRPRCSTNRRAKFLAVRTNAAVFLDGTAWLQVVRSQNTSPPLLQDPLEKERPPLSRRSNGGEAKRKKFKCSLPKLVECFRG